ncbi:hypothetical protein OAV88_02755 [bacterium]|nr:hypothetical protein [bacterium]
MSSILSSLLIFSSKSSKLQDKEWKPAFKFADGTSLPYSLSLT